MSAEIERRCGTCKFWDDNGRFKHLAIGSCLCKPNAPIPSSFTPEPMLELNGTNCPCWEPKQ